MLIGRPAIDPVELLTGAGVTVEPGLSVTEIVSIEHRFGFTFAPAHRELLTAGLPTGERWPDWRGGTDLDEWLAWPADGLLFDTRLNHAWPRSWGARPPGDQIDAIARRHIRRLPILVPIYAHRFVPAAPTASPSPVFSVYQSDVIYYGSNLGDYLNREFVRPAPREPPAVTVRVPFWSDLAEGIDLNDL